MGNKRILVAALNWGLGHATRCIPIIRELEDLDLEPIIASDGAALELLKKEFPHLISIELPSYDITYSIKAAALKWKLLSQSPRILKAINAEKKLTESLVEKYSLSGIISDNRFGIRSEKIKKNVFITHQLKVLSGSTTPISTYIHQKYFQKYEECWVPDLEGDLNLSGCLGHPENKPTNIRYIGPLSRMEKTELPGKYDYLILLSGPEPQRSLLESKLLLEFQNTESKVLLVRGVFNKQELMSRNPRLIIKDHLYGKSLENAINASNVIISRSGYTTLMDLSRMEKKAFFIPTPGQLEQEYLAERMETLKMAPFCKQEDFRVSKLLEIQNYTGLRDFGKHTLLRDRLAFFQGE